MQYNKQFNTLIIIIINISDVSYFPTKFVSHFFVFTWIALKLVNLWDFTHCCNATAAEDTNA
jgi:hypothetical protein